MRRWVMAGLAMGLTLGGAAQAQTLAAVEAAQKALVQAYDQTPLTTAVALFVKQKAVVWGGYEARGDGKFKPGEPIDVYIEPVGLKHKADGGLITCGITADLQIKRGDDILFGRDNFLKADFPSHYAVTEVMLNAEVNLSGAPPGDYTMALVLHDHVSGQTATVNLPFSYVP